MAGRRDALAILMSSSKREGVWNATLLDDEAEADLVLGLDRSGEDVIDIAPDVSRPLRVSNLERSFFLALSLRLLVHAASPARWACSATVASPRQHHLPPHLPPHLKVSRSRRRALMLASTRER